MPLVTRIFTVVLIVMAAAVCPAEDRAPPSANLDMVGFTWQLVVDIT